MKVFSIPEGQGGIRETVQVKRTVIVSLKSIEDMTIDNQEVRNCAVIERTTYDNGAVVVENTLACSNNRPGETGSKTNCCG